MLTKGRERINISRQKIVNYWKGKIDINTTWENALSNCWACGSNRYGTLERSHIIPDCLNGSVDVYNLILLCKFCNAQNPETIYKEDYFLWLKSRVNKEKNYILDVNNPFTIAVEYENMYGKTMNSGTALNKYYFTEEGSYELFGKYLEKYQHLCLLRYPSSRAILYHKFNELLRECIDYIVENDIEDEYENVFVNLLKENKLN